MYHSVPDGKYGENLYWEKNPSAYNVTSAASILAWYVEIDDYQGGFGESTGTLKFRLYVSQLYEKICNIFVLQAISRNWYGRIRRRLAAGFAREKSMVSIAPM